MTIVQVCGFDLSPFDARLAQAPLEDEAFPLGQHAFHSLTPPQNILSFSLADAAPVDCEGQSPEVPKRAETNFSRVWALVHSLEI